MESTQTTISEILPQVFKTVGLAMGVAAVVLSVLGSAEMDTLVTLLSIGLASLGIASLNQE
jgi:hypothetical protein